MGQDLLYVGQAVQHYSAKGDRILRYSVEMRHDGLKEHKVLSASDHDILVTKARFQAERWNAKWIEAERKRISQEHREASAEEAERKTHEAEEAIEELRTILEKTLSINDAIDWESLKVHDSFPEGKPPKPLPPKTAEPPSMPDPNAQMYQPKLGFLDRLFRSLKEKKLREAADRLSEERTRWEQRRAGVEKVNLERERKFQESIAAWENEVRGWESKKLAFEKEQLRFNSHIDEMHASYAAHDLGAVEQYCEMVLNNSSYPEAFTKDFELEYNPETRILVIEYGLPNPESMPKIREVKYVKTRNELKETLLPEAQSQRIYDDVIYQVVLRTVHELFEADTTGAIDAISLNGWVHFVSKATGKDEDACIVSIQVKKSEFVEIDLSRIEPKACFKNLKGVGSSKLHGITPVVPILQINKADRRFVEGREVADKLAEGDNIAAMDWEDFEHLIRELFGEEFSSNGGEVKITQASRDGGVDAVAFDPDPIRGGKIVIQAKRYTNTVGVSAVRDLYGTLINEGATKGILVTTADYGPDAYEFAKGKPLTLLNGAHLLSLLEKHGHQVRIDLAEARKAMREDSA